MITQNDLDQFCGSENLYQISSAGWHYSNVVLAWPIDRTEAIEQLHLDIYQPSDFHLDNLGYALLTISAADWAKCVKPLK